jgi:Pectinacetylesterase
MSENTDSSAQRAMRTSREHAYDTCGFAAISGRRFRHVMVCLLPALVAVAGCGNAAPSGGQAGSSATFTPPPGAAAGARAIAGTGPAGTAALSGGSGARVSTGAAGAAAVQGVAGRAAPAGTSGTTGAIGSPQAGVAGTVTTAGGAGAGAQPDTGGGPALVPTGPNTASGFMNLAPPMGAPLDGKGTTLSPAAPSGWVWYAIDGAVCRDGSPTGFYVRPGSADKLLVYLEGGGACSSPGFCDYNPANVEQVLNGDGQTVAGSIGGAVAGRQEPGTDGIFDQTQADNPFKDWNEIYVPYCTGDVHFGTRKDVMVPGVTAPQQFVGYANMQKFIGRIVPTFKDKVSRVVLTGASAGGFGAMLNYSMVQDAFGSVLVTVLDDSGPSFADKFMPVCMQKHWRDLWGFKDAFPADCTECQQADGGGLSDLPTFIFRKHPNASIGIVSSMEDEVIRLFYSSGLNDCSSFDTADPTTITLGQGDPTVYMPADNYSNGLTDLRMRALPSGRVATYYLGGGNISFHQHVWRARFFDAAAGTETIAAWSSNLLAGRLEQIGP